MFKVQIVQIFRRNISLLLCLFISGISIAAAVGSDIDHDGFEDSADLCPYYYNPDQKFHNVIGCQDKDDDGFEDMFWDACPGENGRDKGCTDEKNYTLLASNGDPTIKLVADACYLTEHTVTEGDILMIQVQDKTQLQNDKPLFSYPIKVE